MDEIPILGQDDERAFKQFLAVYDAPAFIRRARQTQNAYDDLLAFCGQQRDEALKWVRARLGTLHALAGRWDRLQPLLAGEEQLRVVEALHAGLRPEPRPEEGPVRSERTLRRELRELCASLERFNQRWSAFLDGLDLRQVNDLRDGYNRWYVLEKECAVRSARVARQGFEPLPPVTREELAALFPPLPVPRLRGA